MATPPPPGTSPARRKRPHLPGEPAAEEGHAGAASSPPAGFIFMCSGATKPECFRYRVMGLPVGRLAAVSRIRRGAALFLYDFDAKHLYGPYRADSDGGLALEPAAFQGRYPAQVKFTIDGDFMPIPESSVRSAIKENYSHRKFRPELTYTQVEKLRTMFRPIVTVPEPAPMRYLDDRHPAPLAAHLPSLASHPTQPATFAHHSTAYVPPGVHRVPLEAYAHSYSYLPPPTAQFSNATGYPYQAGYQAYDPFPGTYQNVHVPPSQYPYAQYSMPESVPRPVYLAYSYYAAHQNDPYQLDAVKSHYQESTSESERIVYGTAHQSVGTNMQPVSHYAIPSSEITAAEAAVTNIQLARDYGSAPSSAALNLQLVRGYGSGANAHGAASAI